MCDFPKKAYRVDSGLVFSRPEGHSGVFIPIPCGQCVGCHLDRRRDWIVRGGHELQMHGGVGMFVTLTFDDEHLPRDLNLDREALRLGLRRLAYVLGERARGLWCGEYGGVTGRAHFHAVLFGWWPPDAKLLYCNSRGDSFYASALVSDAWGLGHVMFSEVTPQTIGYVAGYLMKDLANAPEKGKAYELLLPSGELVPRAPPFGGRSTHPGIGRSWFDKYGDFVMSFGHVAGVNGAKLPVPRYYLKLWEARDPEGYARFVDKRQSIALRSQSIYEGTEERRRVKSVVRAARIGMAKRGSAEAAGPRVLAVGAEYAP